MSEKTGNFHLVAIPIITRFLHWFATGLIVPLTGLMFLSKGIRLDQIGFITAAYSFIIVLLELPTGILSDRIGRKRVYIISAVISIAGYSVILFGKGFVPIIIGFSLYGIARSLASGSIESVFIDHHIDHHGNDKLHKFISKMNVAETAGLASGALIGGFIPMIFETWYPQANKYNGNLTVQIAIMLLLIFLTAFFVEDSSGSETKRVKLKDFINQIIQFARKNKVVRMMLIATVFWGICFTAIETYWQPQVKSILGSDGSTWIFGLLSTGYFAAAIIGNLTISAVFSRIKLNYFLLLMVFRIFISGLIILLAFQANLFGFGAVYLIMFLFNGMSSPPESTMYNREIKKENRASMLSMQSLFLQLGGVAASIVYSILLTYTTISVIWMIAAGLFGLSSILYGFIAKNAY
jgi:MFS family permease